MHRARRVLIGAAYSMSAIAPIATKFCIAAKCREWDGPAALPPPTALRVRGGLVRRRSVAMPRRSTVRAVSTIGIDMGVYGDCVEQLHLSGYRHRRK